MAHVNQFFDLKWRKRILAPSGLPVDQSPELNRAALAHGSTAVQRAMAVDFRSYLVDDILVKVDRASMLSSLEVRAPLLDHKIIEFAYGRVPDHLRAVKGQRKVILRRLGRPAAISATRSSTS